MDDDDDSLWMGSSYVEMSFDFCLQKRKLQLTSQVFCILYCLKVAKPAETYNKY